MKNPDFYIQYTDYGYIEDDRPKGFSFASCLAFGMIIVILFSVFALGAVFKSTYTNLIEMDTNINREFTNVQNAMQNGRIENIPDVIKSADASIIPQLEAIYEDILACNQSFGEVTTPEELDNTNAKLMKNIERFLALVESNTDTFENDYYRKVMNSIESADKKITSAKENYNVAVREYNQALVNFPGTLLADFFDFEPVEEFESDRKIR